MDDDQKFRIIEDRLDAVEAAGLERTADFDRFDAFFALIATLTDPQRFAAEVKSFGLREVAAKQAQTDLAEERRQLDEQVQTERSRLTGENGALIKRLVAAQEEAERLSKAFERQKSLVRAWTLFGESVDVANGFASPSRPALSKARKAHGIADDWQEDPTVPFEEARPSVPSIFPSRSKRTERTSRRF
jgi:hypothetical protein